MFVQNESVWLTQKGMAELFNVGVPAINKHLANVFECGELMENSVISILETTANDGKKYKTKFYNLDAIISVGYRVNSTQATKFRIWATQTLRQYIIKGFVIDDEKLKKGKNFFGQDYFKELMDDLNKSVNKFLSFNEYKILHGKGKISHKKAEQKVATEYEAFNRTQKIESDFDKEVIKRLKNI